MAEFGSAGLRPGLRRGGGSQLCLVTISGLASVREDAAAPAAGALLLAGWAPAFAATARAAILLLLLLLLVLLSCSPLR